jgi:DNA-binding NarL/FixJ family response regulator
VLPNRDQASAALAAGARGIVLRDQVGPSVVPALAAVRCGLTVLDPSMANAVVTPAPQRAANDQVLTARERQVVQLLSEGLSNKRIAPRLGISEHTVKFHVNSILTKFGADTRTEAVVQALRLGLVIL